MTGVIVSAAADSALYGSLSGVGVGLSFTGLVGGLSYAYGVFGGATAATQFDRV